MIGREQTNLDVVVGLLGDQLDVGGSSSLDRCGGRAEGDQRASGLVTDGTRLGLQEIVDAADESTPLGWIVVAHLKEKY